MISTKVIVMKKNMNLALAKPIYDPLDHFIDVINELLEKLKESKNSVVNNISYCRKIRTSRKVFEKEIKKVLLNFSTYSEKQQNEIEFHFYKVIRELEQKVPSVIENLKKEEGLFVSYFLRREVRKALNIFKRSQKKMSVHLYPDHSKEILSNPEEYQKLVDVWGNLAEDEY